MNPMFLTAGIQALGNALGSRQDAPQEAMPEPGTPQSKMQKLMKALKTMGMGVDALNKQRNMEKDRAVMDAQRFGGMNIGGIAPSMGPVQQLPIPDFTPIQSPSQLRRFF